MLAQFVDSKDEFTGGSFKSWMVKFEKISKKKTETDKMKR